MLVILLYKKETQQITLMIRWMHGFIEKEEVNMDKHIYVQDERRVSIFKDEGKWTIYLLFD